MSASQGKPSRLQTSRLAELLAKAKPRVENLTALLKTMLRLCVNFNREILPRLCIKFTRDGTSSRFCVYCGRKI